MNYSRVNYSNANHSSSMNNVISKVNPWDDNKNFIQDVGDLDVFLNFLDRSDILDQNTLNNKAENNGHHIIDLSDKNFYHHDDIISNNNFNLLNQLNEISKTHFDKLKSLELFYDKYRNQCILSKTKNDELCDRISCLSEVFEKIDNNRIKLANLIHNTHLSDNNIIKIKHDKKFEFIKIMKSILSQLDNRNITQRNDIELIKLSSNVHPETINKIKIKYQEVLDTIEDLVKEYEKVDTT